MMEREPRQGDWRKPTKWDSGQSALRRNLPPRRPISAARRRLKSYITLTQRKFPASLRITWRQRNHAWQVQQWNGLQREKVGLCVELSEYCLSWWWPAPLQSDFWYGAKVSSWTPTELINEWMNECVLHRRRMLVECVAQTEQTMNVFTAAKSKDERISIPFNVKGWGWNCRDSELQSSKRRCQSQMKMHHVLAPQWERVIGLICSGSLWAIQLCFCWKGRRRQGRYDWLKWKHYFWNKNESFEHFFVAFSVVGITP